MRPNPAVTLLIFPIALAATQAPAGVGDSTSATIPLAVEAGSPLRVYLTKRLPERLGQEVHAQLLEPLFAFDRQVAPAGSEVLGKITRLQSVPKMQRTAAIVRGDFTPLHVAEVRFDTLVLSDGHRIPLHTLESTPMDTIVPLHPRKPRKTVAGSSGGVLGTARRQGRAQMDAAKDRVQGIADMVRGPDKKERLVEFVLMKLPWHPQWVKRGTRFDPELSEPLQFGTESVKTDALRFLGTQPPPDAIAHVRLLTTLDSRSAKEGMPVQAVLSQPLFSTDARLILPAGTHFTGAVVRARPARWLRRGGQLRFSFQTIELPRGVARPQAPPENEVTKTQADVASVEAAGSGTLKVDDEGGIKATEPKTRFLAPVISVLIAARTLDNDHDRERLSGANGNAGGRTLGGISGFGMLGAAAAQASRTVGTVFGFYGMAFSVYSNILARGNEVQFDRNAAMDIRFGGRQPVPASKFRADLRGSRN